MRFLLAILIYGVTNFDIDTFMPILLYFHKNQILQEWMIGVLGHDSALLRLYWAGDNLGEWHECCYEPCSNPTRGDINISNKTMPLFYTIAPSRSWGNCIFIGLFTPQIHPHQEWEFLPKMRNYHCGIAVNRSLSKQAFLLSGFVSQAEEVKEWRTDVREENAIS